MQISKKKTGITIEKQAGDMNRQFLEEVQMNSKCMRGHLMSPVNQRNENLNTSYILVHTYQMSKNLKV